MTPPAYYLKYAVLDLPGESAAAANPASQPTLPPIEFRYAQLEQDRAEHGTSPAERLAAIGWLTNLVLSPYAQVTHPFECLGAKTTLGQVGMTDPDPHVKAAANDCLIEVAAKGAVIKR